MEKPSEQNGWLSYDYFLFLQGRCLLYKPIFCDHGCTALSAQSARHQSQLGAYSFTQKIKAIEKRT